MSCPSLRRRLLIAPQQLLGKVTSSGGSLLQLKRSGKSISVGFCALLAAVLSLGVVSCYAQPRAQINCNAVTVGADRDACLSRCAGTRECANIKTERANAAGQMRSQSILPAAQQTPITSPNDKRTPSRIKFRPVAKSPPRALAGKSTTPAATSADDKISASSRLTAIASKHAVSTVFNHKPSGVWSISDLQDPCIDPETEGLAALIPCSFSGRNAVSLSLLSTTHLPTSNSIYAQPLSKFLEMFQSWFAPLDHGGAPPGYHYAERQPGRSERPCVTCNSAGPDAVEALDEQRQEVPLKDLFTFDKEKKLDVFIEEWVRDKLKISADGATIKAQREIIQGLAAERGSTLATALCDGDPVCGPLGLARGWYLAGKLLDSITSRDSLPSVLSEGGAEGSTFVAPRLTPDSSPARPHD